MIIILLAVALGGAIFAWLRADERADMATRQRDEAVRLARQHQRDARCLYQQLQTANAKSRQYRRRLAMYEPTDRPITDVDEFLNGLLGGQR